MERKAKAVKLIALFGMIGLFGCDQSAPPMSKATFTEAARRCGLKATTYLYRDGVVLDEPLIDFTKELAPAKAHACFNSALEKRDREMIERGVKHISYIWEWRA